MLNFITLKKDPRMEVRLYTENQNFVGKVIYSGHKLGVDGNLLSNILDYKMERTSDRVFLMDYDSEDRWFVGSKNNLLKVLNESYDSLQRKAEKEFGKFRKITITVI